MTNQRGTTVSDGGFTRVCQLLLARLALRDPSVEGVETFLTLEDETHRPAQTAATDSPTPNIEATLRAAVADEFYAHLRAQTDSEAVAVGQTLELLALALPGGGATPGGA